MAENRIHIGTMVPTTNSFGIDVLRGILNWAREHENWRFTLYRHYWRPGWNLPFPAEDPVQGVIAMIQDRELEIKLSALNVPIVNVSATRKPKRIPLVHVDDLAVGKMGAEHLMNLGFRHFLFVGQRIDCRGWYEYSRGAGFVRRLREAGFTSHFAWQVRGGWSVSPHWQILPRLENWLSQLERPLGIMVALDDFAETTLGICKRVGLTVPQEAAILGVDNDVLTCESLEVPLSSIDLRAERVGAKAAELLSQMMRGTPAPAQPILLPPVRVAARGSTESVVVEDQVVREAIEFIRANIHKPLQVSDITQHLNCTRRTLERGFRLALQRTPYDQIVRTRVERAQHLLSCSNLPIAEVGVQCGFEYPHHFTMVFKRRAGMTPKVYRKRFRT